MKVIKYICYIIFFLFLFIELFIHSEVAIISINSGIQIWISKVVPTLLPFFLLSNFLINYGLIEILSEIFKPIMKLLKINENSTFIFILSIFTGSPGNAFYTKEALDKGLITNGDATKILMITQFASPLFILNTVFYVLQNKKATIIILLISYLTNIILAILFYFIYPCNNSSNINLNKIKTKLENLEPLSFGKILANSINKTFNTLILILGSICFFFLITTIIELHFSFSNIIMTFISGILEMTQGIIKVKDLLVSLPIKMTLITIFISFGGFSIHSQVTSIISDKKIKYLPYFLARVLHAIIAGGLVFILSNYI